MPPVADSVAEYPCPTCPGGKDAAPICRPLEFTTTSVTGTVIRCTFGEELSVTCTEKLYVPAALGEPVKLPVADSPIPPGRFPTGKNEYGAEPPTAVNVKLYGAPSVACGSVGFASVSWANPGRETAISSSIEMRIFLNDIYLRVNLLPFSIVHSVSLV